MKQYTSPEFVDFGSIVAKTGHCSSGCDHDSVLHPDEFKSSGGDMEMLEALIAC